MTRSRTWTLGTAVVVVLVLLAGWFLLVAPTRADAAAVEEQTVNQQQANVALAAKIETLKVQAQDLPAQEAKLANFRQRIPADPQLPSFIRSLSSIADKSNVVLVSMEPQVPATLSTPAPAPTAAPDESSETSGEVTLNTAPASSVQFVQAQVTISGGYFNTEQFFSKLEGLKRSFLVTGFDIASDDSAEATSGDVVTHLQVRVYFAPLPADAAPAATTVTN